MKIDNPQQEIVIRPGRSWLSFDWQGLFHYRDLLFLFVHREFVAKYRQTILGATWFILQPLLTSGIFTIVFKKGLNLSTEGLPPTLFYFCALVPWSYFSQCLNSISSSLTTSAAMFRKVYFPRLIVPFSHVLSNLIGFALQFATFLAFYFCFIVSPASASIHPNPIFLLALPVLLLQTAATALGAGLWVAALTIKYRDLQHAMPFLTNLWMYVTPIIYSSSVIPEKWRPILALNPMAGIVESYRFAFFGTAYVNIHYLLISLAVTFLLLFTGLLMFNRAESDFVDVL